MCGSDIVDIFVNGRPEKGPHDGFGTLQRISEILFAGQKYCFNRDRDITYTSRPIVVVCILRHRRHRSKCIWHR